MIAETCSTCDLTAVEARRGAAFWLERMQRGLREDDLAALARWLTADDAHGRAWERALDIWDCLDLADQHEALVAMRRQAQTAIRRQALAPRGTSLCSLSLPWVAAAIAAGLPQPSPAPSPVTLSAQGAVQRDFLQFDNEPLGSVVQKLNQHARRPIVIRDARVAALRISGAFPADDTASFVQTLLLLYPLRVRHLPDGSIEILPPLTR